MKIMPNKYQKLVDEMLKNLDISLNDKYNIEFIHHDSLEYQIIRNKVEVKIFYNTKNQIFASIINLLANSENKNFNKKYKASFKNTGLMLDVARNAVPKIETLKKYILILASMGYNFLELYLEDLFEVENEPKFGYMRGKYSTKDLKELDDFAFEYGIEIIPAIQTLAHLDAIFKHEEYGEIHDIDDILLPENDRTYLLIDNMLKTVSKTFRSKTVNIGMDEAWKLGLGNFLKINGYKDRTDIMKTHLKKVNELCKKYNLKPKMWADMFFNLAGANYHLDQIKEIPQHIIDIVPKDIELIFWEYFANEKSYYDLKFQNMKQMTNNYSFAGGAIKWLGFTPNNQLTINILEKSIASALDNNSKNFLLTAWGDNGAEASHFSILPTLIYLRAKNFQDNESLDKYSKILTNYSFDELISIDLPNILYDNEISEITNPSKYLLYEDLLMGDLYQTPKTEYDTRYESHEKTLRRLAEKDSQFNYIYKSQADLALVLKDKASLGVRIYNAYHSNNLKLLNSHQKKILKIVDNLEKFEDSFNFQWHHENKRYGYEIQNYRLGGLKERLKYINKVLDDYLKGNLTKIEELEERVLKEIGKENNGTYSINNFAFSISPSRL